MQPKIDLYFPCGHIETLNYDFNKCGIKGRRYNGSRPIKAVIHGSVELHILKSLNQILHPVHREIIQM